MSAKDRQANDFGFKRKTGRHLAGIIGSRARTGEKKTIAAEQAYGEELEEALLALAALGYSERELRKISTQLGKEKMTTDQYIKRALQMLMKQ